MVLALGTGRIWNSGEKCSLRLQKGECLQNMLEKWTALSNSVTWNIVHNPEELLALAKGVLRPHVECTSWLLLFVYKVVQERGGTTKGTVPFWRKVWRNPSGLWLQPHLVKDSHRNDHKEKIKVSKTRVTEPWWVWPWLLVNVSRRLSTSWFLLAKQFFCYILFHLLMHALMCFTQKYIHFNN